MGSKTRSITLAEVAQHKGENDSFWTVVEGEVYDVSSFVSQHPGGPALLRLAGGIDSTGLVESYHGTESQKKVMAVLKNKLPHVGTLADPEPRPDDRFFQTVRTRVEKLLSDKKLTRHACETRELIEAFLTLVLFYFATYMVSWHNSTLFAVIEGIVIARLGFIMHGGNHCGTSSSATINWMVGSLMDCIGGSSIVWKYEHQVAHHLDPNELGKDNDCQIGDPTFRLHPALPRKPAHKYQHIMVILGITGGFFKWVIGDLFCIWEGKVGSASWSANPRDKTWTAVWKTFWVLIRVVIPLYKWGIGSTLFNMIIYMGVGAHYLENIFIVNHIQDGLVPPKGIHWAAKQVKATANWCSGSEFWNWFSGGLNHQVEHHLFPSISIGLYPTISPVVKQTCEEFNIPYNNYNSFPEAWWAMVSYLKNLGADDYAKFHVQ